MGGRYDEPVLGHKPSLRGWDLPPQDHKEWKRQPSVEGKKGVSVPGEEERMLGRYRHTPRNCRPDLGIVSYAWLRVSLQLISHPGVTVLRQALLLGPLLCLYALEVLVSNSPFCLACVEEGEAGAGSACWAGYGSCVSSSSGAA